MHSATKHTPHYLTHGRAARLPTDALLGQTPAIQWSSYDEYVEQLLKNTRQAFENVRESVQKACRANQARRNDKARLRQLSVGDQVLLFHPQIKPGESKKLSSPWKSGYRIIDKFGQVNYYIEHEKSQKRQLVHIDRLKLRHSREPRQRGQPQGSAPMRERAALRDEGESWYDAPSPPLGTEGIEPVSGGAAGASAPEPGPLGPDPGGIDAQLPAPAARDRPSRSSGPAAAVGIPGLDQPAGIDSAPRKRDGEQVRERGESGRARGVGPAGGSGAERTDRSDLTDDSSLEPASGTDTSDGEGEEDTISSSAEENEESGSSSGEEPNRYARIADTRRYPTRERRAPDRYSPRGYKYTSTQVRRLVGSERVADVLEFPSAYLPNWPGWSPWEEPCYGSS